MEVRAEELEEGSGGGCGCGAYCVSYLSTCVVCSSSPGQMIEQLPTQFSDYSNPLHTTTTGFNILGKGTRVSFHPKCLPIAVKMEEKMFLCVRFLQK